MKRWTLNILTGLSLLLCVAVVLLWPTSYGLTDQVAIDSESFGSWMLTSREGVLVLSGNTGRHVSLDVQRFGPGRAGSVALLHHELGNFELDAERHFVHQSSYTEFTYAWFCRAPHWSLALLFAFLPATRLILVYRRRRRLHAPGFPVEQS